MIKIRHIEKQELLGDIFPMFCEFYRTIFLERFPEEKPWSNDHIRSVMSQPAPRLSGISFIATDGDKVVGYTALSEWGSETLGSLLCTVLPEYRRQGIGSKLVNLSLPQAKQKGFLEAFTQTYNQESSRFVEKLGGKMIAKQSMRNLEFENIDWDLIDGWITNMKSANPNVRLVISDGIDDSQIEGLAKVSLEIAHDLSAMNRLSKKHTIESEMADWKRRQEDAKLDTGKRFFLFAYENEELCGYSNVVWHKSDTEFVRQGMTAVPSKFRVRGFGKLLKATMLDYIRKNLGKIKRISTYNNDLNAPMVAINDRLGFVKSTVFTDYLIPLAER
jgi:RimJ/RimL family protein N-acetyltransferase